MNKITLDTSHLRPATMAAMIADLMDEPLLNIIVCRSLLTQIETSVGEEMAIEFLNDAGVTPGQLASVTGILA